jgi:hypothetical protein
MLRFVDQAVALSNRSATADLSSASQQHSSSSELGLTSTSVTTGYAVQMQMEAVTECSYAGPTGDTSLFLYTTLFFYVISLCGLFKPCTLTDKDSGRASVRCGRRLEVVQPTTTLPAPSATKIRVPW